MEFRFKGAWQLREFVYFGPFKWVYRRAGASYVWHTRSICPGKLRSTVGNVSKNLLISIDFLIFPLKGVGEGRLTHINSVVHNMAHQKVALLLPTTSPWVETSLKNSDGLAA